MGESVEGQQSAREVGTERQTEQAVGNGAAEGARCCPFRIDMNPLMVVGCVREGVHTLLGDVVPRSRAEFCTDECAQIGGGGRTDGKCGRIHDFSSDSRVDVGGTAATPFLNLTPDSTIDGGSESRHEDRHDVPESPSHRGGRPALSTRKWVSSVKIAGEVAVVAEGGGGIGAAIVQSLVDRDTQGVVVTMSPRDDGDVPTRKSWTTTAGFAGCVATKPPARARLTTEEFSARTPQEFSCPCSTSQNVPNSCRRAYRTSWLRAYTRPKPHTTSRCALPVTRISSRRSWTSSRPRRGSGAYGTSFTRIPAPVRD